MKLKAHHWAMIAFIIQAIVIFVLALVKFGN
jgi:hypothetical protein